MRFVPRALVAGLGLSAVLAAAPAHAFGLLDAYMAARQYDPQYRSAWQAREAGLQEERIARAQLLPRASIVYGYNRNWLNQEVYNPTNGQSQRQSNSNYPSYNGRLEIRQPVVNLQAWAGFRQGQAMSQLAEAEFDGRHQELMLRLYEAYSNALLARDQLAIAEARKAALEEQMKSNDLMFKAGEGTRTDMIETRSRHDVAAADVIAARDTLGDALRQLSALTGPGHVQDINDLDQLVPNFSPAPLPFEDVERWIELGVSSNAQIVAGRLNVQAADANVDRNRAGHYPTVDLIAMHQQNEADTVTTINQRNRVNVVGVQLSVPLYAGGGVTASTRQAVANYERAVADLDGMRDAVIVELRRQHAMMQSNATRIQALESAVESATLLVEATRKSVQGGTRVNLDVLNAEEQLYQSRHDLARARYEYLNAYMRLRYFAGVLNIDDMETVARYFAPAGSVRPGSAYSQAAQPAGGGTAAPARQSAVLRPTAAR